MLTKHVLFIMGCWCSLLSISSAFGGECSAEGDCDVSIDLGLYSCYLLSDSGCDGSLGGISTEEVSVSEPTPLGDVECNTCGLDFGWSNRFTYTRTLGYSYCFTMGVDVNFNLPLSGIGWSFNAAHELCNDTEVSTSIDVELECAPNTHRKVEVWMITRTMKADVTVNFMAWADYVANPNGGCPDPQPIHNEAQCSPETRTAFYNVATYTTIGADIGCPPKPGSACSTDYDLIVYKLAVNELENNITLESNYVEVYIPCYYYEH